ncbi:MAG: LysM peptidoglycan-binding domain-containing protein [Chloroflexota bacterium]|nr:LysM peptidoglycan-binding domain-containing protein [Chloroflexota bacterium]
MTFTRFKRTLIIILAAGMIGMPAVFAQDATPVPEATPSGVTIHVVQRGENLTNIATAYSMTVEALAALNGIANPNNIAVGQRLLVPNANVDVVLMPGDAPAPIFYTIQAGETLYRIALRYNISASALAAANGIADPALIYTGQRLTIPLSRAADSELVSASAYPAPVTAFAMRPVNLVEGQTGRFRLTASAPITVTGRFLDRAFVAGSDAGGTSAVILVGIPIDTQSGSYPLDLTITSDAGQTTMQVAIPVVGKVYRSEVINVLADRSNLLDPAIDEAELNILRGVMSAFNPERYFVDLMGLPAAAGISSPFGSSRVYSGSDIQRIHTGTDFAGAPGSPIFAPAPGRVVLADTLNIRGVATVIDHGWGVYTGYWHQTEHYVSVGDNVTAGQVIGAIGSTGRVTGAHLHWELWVNGVPVDPMQWVSVSFVD